MEDGSTAKNVWTVVCDYGPNGNWEGSAPYKKGASCSDCPSSAPFCYQKLCRNCAKDGVDLSQCQCNYLDCGDCGTAEKDTCSCKCDQGYTGDKCDTKCSNKFPSYCGRIP